MKCLSDLERLKIFIQTGFTYDQEKDIVYSHKKKPVSNAQLRIKNKIIDITILNTLFKYYYIHGNLDGYEELKKDRIKAIYQLKPHKIHKVSTTIKKPSKSSKTSQKKYIIDTELLYQLLISKGKGKLTNSCLQMLIKIPYELSRKFDFKREEEKEDAIQEAIYRILKGWKSFDENKYESPFRYFTEMSKRAFAKSYNQYRGKYKAIDKIPSMISLSNFCM